MLVVYAILAFIAMMVSRIILKKFFPASFTSEPAPFQEALSGLLLYVFFFLFTLRMLSRSGLSYNNPSCQLVCSCKSMGHPL